MTRLVEADINEVVIRLRQYDEELKQQIGHSLVEVAMHAVNLEKRVTDYKTAVVPVTSGLGIIDGFSDTVCGILKYCGIDAYVTQGTDVAGLQEAYGTGAELVFMADDNICSAFSIVGKPVFSDNGYATGTGFAAALTMGMKEKEEVLVMGAGPVGTAAAAYLDAQEIPVSVYDVLPEKATKAVEGLTHAAVLKEGRKKHEFTYIFDGTPVGEVLSVSDVRKDTLIAAPGMPLGITEEGRKIATVIYNPLELGIITMYFDCVKQLAGEGAV